MTTEGRIKKACLRYLKKKGIVSWNNPSGAVRVRPDKWLHFGKKGSSDIIGILPGGRFLAIEVKTREGRLTPDQRDFLDTIRGQGGLALIVRDWKELDNALHKAGYITDGVLFDQDRKEKSDYN